MKKCECVRCGEEKMCFDQHPLMPVCVGCRDKLPKVSVQKVMALQSGVPAHLGVGEFGAALSVFNEGTGYLYLKE